MENLKIKKNILNCLCSDEAKTEVENEGVDADYPINNSNCKRWII